MRIAVIDGQGGGIGKYIVEKLRQNLPKSLEIIALGTNSLATAAMLKAGANDGATGENAICYMVGKVDVITGSVSILSANSFLGELTPQMAEAVASANAHKVLLPINRNNLEIIGAVNGPLPQQVDLLIERIKQLWEDSQDV